MRFTCPACTVVLAAAISTACVVSVDSQGQIVREEKRFSVSGTPDVRVTTFDGSIEVQSWDRAEVLIEIEKRGPTREAIDALEIKSSQDGNVIELDVKRPRSETFSSMGFRRSPSARLIVTIPKRADVRARSGDGSIRIERVEGRLEVRTGDGSIRAADVSGNLEFNTGDGSINVDGAEGRLAVDTGDGSVHVSGKLSALKMHTGDGSIVFRAQPGGSMTEDWDISTGDGGVALYLPPDFSAEIDAHTGDGTITNDLTLASSEGVQANRRTVRGRLGAGGRLLRVRTGDGSIRLKSN